MVNRYLITIALSAALSGIATARNCGVGYYYCGSNLLSKGDYYADIIGALEDAEEPTDEDHVENSLFLCKGPDDVPFVEYCEDGCDNEGAGSSDTCN
ncbi:uncharacterized protein GGS22DRAFT_184087 [Annulohypoxylon maeteangense]|uniref:uncharacterized protein n=1 Tax=Annulohypoxylon maeteangense TaxID=1927788 RepID=UPI0020080F5F|nr:uncharacterized protein GGS22DRAFT_184087 [Annulohypoxylon maeteangense]KAI0890741.1 hypothetical protein GGS22DRAFT_184087 [Annulohypoxylon maeteangense]